MESLPRISIVTPSFNQGQYLERMLVSILDQGYPNLELIIIDGGSTDDTLDILEKYNSKIDFWVSEIDNGQSHAINKGIDRSSGEVINWMNCDDRLTPGSLKLIGDFFQENEEVALVYGNYNVIDINDKILSETKPESNDFNARLLGYYPIQHPSTFFARSILDDVGLLNESYHYCMDADLFTRISLKGEVAYVDKVIAEFRIHADSKTGMTEVEFTKELIPIYSSVMKGIGRKDLIDILRKLELYDEQVKPYDIQRNLSDEEVERSLGYFLVKQSRMLLPLLRRNSEKRALYFDSLRKYHPVLFRTDPFITKLRKFFLPISLMFEYLPGVYDRLRRIYSVSIPS